MPGFLTSLIRAGIKSVRELFTGKPPDSVRLSGDALALICEGHCVSAHVRDVQHASVQESFLGLFGSTLTLKLANGSRYLIRGLEGEHARTTRDAIRAAVTRLLSAEVQERLHDSRSRIDDAYRALHLNEYLSAAQMTAWLEHFSDLCFLASLQKKTLREISLSAEAESCRRAFSTPDAWRAERNDRWVAEALNSQQALLDSLGNVPLTANQREAVIRNDNRVLAVAGAGTGKTSTVVARVAYLLKTQWCRPGEILLLSFSRGAVNELRERVHAACGDEVQVRTFHSLGLEIIATACGSKPAIFEQTGDNELAERLLSILMRVLHHDAHRKTLLSFVAYHFYPSRDPHSCRTRAEFNQYVAGNDLRTLNGEQVRSNQEVQIANWLYLQGISYTYEAAFREERTGSSQRKVYTPDFRLDDSGIYIEHFGIDRAGRTASWVPRDKYLADMAWKRALHRRNRTTLIETFSYQAVEGTLLEHLKAAILKHGVALRPRTVAEIAQAQHMKARLRGLAQLLATTLCLFKGDRLTVDMLRERIKREGSERRVSVFMELFAHVLAEYEAELQSTGQVDFGDMITQAASHVQSGQFRSPFKAIIVDEFQDISRGRAWLLNSLLEQVPDARLLCVGDDWQSIYRFTGSDVSLMTNFQTHWPQAVRVDLDQSFRFNDKIQTVSERFVTRNPSQLRKNIRCATSRDTPAIHLADYELDDIIQILRMQDSAASILVLGRYRFTLGDIQHGHRDVNNGIVRAMTVHAAKGLEADYVVINNVQAGKYGFPTEMVDDPIIRLFLADSDVFPHAEERRLFYVALTRARREVWIRTSGSLSSPFAQELARDERFLGLVTVEGDLVTTYPECPLCGGCMKVQRNKSDGSVFLGCTDHPRCTGSRIGCPKCRAGIPKLVGEAYQCSNPECTWVGNRCPACRDGFIYSITGKFGAFQTCSMYRTTGCRGTPKRY